MERVRTWRRMGISQRSTIGDFWLQSRCSQMLTRTIQTTFSAFSLLIYKNGAVCGFPLLLRQRACRNLIVRTRPCIHYDAIQLLSLIHI